MAPAIPPLPRGKPTPEYGQPLKQALLAHREMLPSLSQHGLHAAVAVGHMAEGRGELVEVVPDLGGDLRAAQRLCPRRRHLDGQGQAVHKPADLDDGDLVVMQRKTRYDLACPLDEQAYRRTGFDRLILVVSLVSGREREPLDRVQPLLR